MEFNQKYNTKQEDMSRKRMKLEIEVTRQTFCLTFFVDWKQSKTHYTAPTMIRRDQTEP